MPSGTVPGGVMAIADTIWEYPVWQECTKNTVPPFHKDAKTGDTKLTKRQLEAVQALARCVHGATGYTKRLKEFAKNQDNDKVGKEAWSKWIRSNFGAWNVRKDVESVLDMHKRHPRQLISEGRFGSVSVGRLIRVCEEITACIGRWTRYRR